MAYRDLYACLAAEVGLTPADVTSTGANSGAIIDAQTNPGDSKLFVFNVAGIDADPDGDVTVTLKIEHGDDSGLSDAADTDSDDVLIGSTSSPNESGGTATVTVSADGVAKIGYVGNKRYFRLVATVAGTTPDLEIGAVLLTGHLHSEGGA